MASSESIVRVLGERLNRRLAEARDQQQRATTIAAVDGVLLGVGSTLTPATDHGARAVVLIALIVLALGLVVAAFAIWPRAGIPEVAPLKQLAEYKNMSDEDLMSEVAAGTASILWDRAIENSVANRQCLYRLQLVLAFAGAVLLLVAAFETALPTADVACVGFLRSS